MNMRVKHIVEALAAARRKIASLRWGGIGCRVAFLVSASLVTATLVVGLLLYRENKQTEEQEMRSRALWFSAYLSLLAEDPIAAGDQRSLERFLSAALSAEDLASSTVDHELRHLCVYDRDGSLMVRRMSRTEDVPGGPDRLSPEDRLLREPRFRMPGEGRLELLYPVLRETDVIGFLRTGFSMHRFEERLGALGKPIGLIVVVVLVLGLISSQVIAIGILRPLGRLEAAVEELSEQNWKAPVPVRGKDELTRLATAFNRMAAVLNERESSLSQGNRDLFILHTAGLDLMETLDRPALLAKIAARAEDLVRADTVTVTAVDPHSRQLHYLHARGSRARQLQERPLPIEAGGVFNWLATYGTPLLIQDAPGDFRLDPGDMRAHGIRSLMAVPLWSSNTLLATVTVLDKKGGDVFDRRDLRLFTVFANLAAAALQNASLYADLTSKMRELEHTQLQLVHSSKLAAVGELATNLAHEINNPLTSVLGYTSHLLKTLTLPDESRRKLQLMEQETLRVRKIIRNLLDFSRQRPSRMADGDVAVPLREIAALLQGVAERSSVRLVVEYPAEPIIVHMDQNELKQVFINIMNNALHVMPRGGDLTVRIAASAGDVRVSFADTGPGIAAEHLDKVFEPFFTTKNKNDGTGLGLSISDRIVRIHGGRIDVSSEPGRGAVFTVVLPVAERSPVPLMRGEG